MSTFVMWCRRRSCSGAPARERKMSETFADRLVAAIDAKQAPICVGIDPILDMFPEQVFMRGGAARNPNDATAAIDAIYTFTTKVLKVVAPHVPCVKFQSAYFERYLWE